jgi:hypothetical protein
MKTKIISLCLTAAAVVTLSACGNYTKDETTDRAKGRGFTILTNRETRDYGTYPGVPVDIGSTKCAADFVASDRSSSDYFDYLIIYGPDGTVIQSDTTGERFYEPHADTIKKYSQTAVCYRTDQPR